MRLGSLCSGYGGLDLAAEAVLGPMEHLWYAEHDPDAKVQHAAAVCAAHWPDVPNLGDLTAIDWTTVPSVDVLTAGFPCTDVSAAGKRAGLKPGTRTGIWSHIAHGIGVLRPRLVLLENVEGLLSGRAHSDVEPCPWCLGDADPELVVRALGAVLADLADLGFDAEWTTVAASDIGAPHRRRRVFIVAWPSDCPPDARELSRRVGDGAVRADSVTLLPTPTASERDRTSEEAARRHLPGRAMGRSGGASPDLPSVVMHQLLPTPRTNDAKGAGAHGTGGPDLRTAISLLPTPAARDWRSGESNIMDRNARPLNEVIVNLLPTPRATDGTKGGPNQRGSSGDLMLPSAVVQLLPTPTVRHEARNATANRTAVKPTTNANGWTLSDVAYADRWGNYGPAIARWEAITGRTAPDPTETGTKGQPRLAPAFVEWLMGLPAGWVTDHLPRNPALKCLGNGVVWQQAAHAYTELLGGA